MKPAERAREKRRKRWLSFQDIRRSHFEEEKERWNEFNLSEKELLEKISYDQRFFLKQINDYVYTIKNIVVFLFIVQLLGALILIVAAIR